jgi:kynurenine 3-monooxygenase
MSKLSEHVAIFGGGLVGSLLATILARRGCKVDVYERRNDIRLTGGESGRSINLALSDRGLRALQKIGITTGGSEAGIPMYGRMMHSQEGKLTFQPYGKEGQAIYSVSRAELNLALVKLADSQENIRYFFNTRCLEVDLESTTAKVLHLDTREEKQVQTDVIFGADGAFSAVRGSMQKTDRFNFEQFYIEHGYKELTIPAAADGSWQLEKNALHIWPRKQFMMIALPNPDGSFTCTLFFPFEGTNSFKELKTTEQVTTFFKHNFPDAVSLMPDLEEDFFQNPTSSLVTIRCYPWVKGKVALIGDAAHGIVPFYGQGMNAGFEDCRVLDDIIEASAGNWDDILEEYQEQRKPQADAIATMAIQNFTEMRDLVADPNFLLRKKIEATIYNRYPQQWIPQYSMVTFSHIPYSEAQREGARHDEIMNEIMTLEGIETQWETHPGIDAILLKHGII